MATIGMNEKKIREVYDGALLGFCRTVGDHLLFEQGRFRAVDAVVPGREHQIGELMEIRPAKANVILETGRYRPCNAC